MNLFLLDLVLEKNASAMCNKHVVKMILETAQVLWCAWHLHQPEEILRLIEQKFEVKPYKKTHMHHPVSIWIRENAKHYEYAVRYGLLLCLEYTRRYNKVHKTQAHLELLFHLGFPAQVQDVPKPKNAKPITKAYVDIPGDFDYFPMCFDEEYVVRDAGGNVLGVSSYRKYYVSKQDKFKMVWPKGIEPNWFERKNNLMA